MTRVITAAAAVMVAVFAAFVFSDAVLLEAVGVCMASAILIDATVVRLVLVPALLKLMEDANWRMPRWLDRLLPTISSEGQVSLQLPEQALRGVDTVRAAELRRRTCWSAPRPARRHRRGHRTTVRCRPRRQSAGPAGPSRPRAAAQGRAAGLGRTQVRDGLAGAGRPPRSAVQLVHADHDHAGEAITAACHARRST